jgi:hypothetical protein
MAEVEAALFTVVVEAGPMAVAADKTLPFL